MFWGLFLWYDGSMTNNKANHGLRTTGTHTGNFGKAKVQGKRGELDLTPEILNRENLRIPNRQAAYSRLEEAYEKTTDPRLKQFLADELAKYRAQTQLYATRVIAGGTPVTPVDADLDPKGRFRDFGTSWDAGQRDAAYDHIHRVR
jgi:hypothetical protein